MKIVAFVVLSGALLIGISACTLSTSVSTSVPTQDIANTAAKALQNEVGSAKPPALDCGSGRTDLKVGKKLDCTLTDPTSGAKYDTVVTLTKVSGLHYSVDAVVAQSPKS